MTPFASVRSLNNKICQEPHLVASQSHVHSHNLIFRTTSMFKKLRKLFSREASGIHHGNAESSTTLDSGNEKVKASPIFGHPLDSTNPIPPIFLQNAVKYIEEHGLYPFNNTRLIHFSRSENLQNNAEFFWESYHIVSRFGTSRNLSSCWKHSSHQFFEKAIEWRLHFSFFPLHLIIKTKFHPLIEYCRGFSQFWECWYSCRFKFN